MCVLYQKLNSITKPSELTILRCDDAISSVGAGSTKICITILDARQGYHQVSFKVADRMKLAFFAPDNQKYALCVTTFRPTNAPGFY